MTTNDGIPKPVNSAPCTKPMTMPAMMPTAMAGIGAHPCLTLSTATIAAHRPLTAPIDRSISPSSNTNTTPTEIRPTAVICRNRFVRLIAVRK